MDDFDNLITSDTAWAEQFRQALELLEDNATGQLALWPAEDCLGKKRYVPCPRRGTHQRLVECWACWCDVTYGYATLSDVLGPVGDL